MVNNKLLRETLQTIEDNPSCWNKYIHHEGTTHSFAGIIECKLTGRSIFQEFPKTQYTKDHLVHILTVNGLNDSDRLQKLNKYFGNEQQVTVLVGKHWEYKSHTLILAQVALGLSDAESSKLLESKHKSFTDLKRTVEGICNQSIPSTV